MAFWAAAIPIVTSLLGAYAGNRSAKDSGKPTITRNTPGAPPSELGGYGRLSGALDRIRDAPQYRVGADNPYLSGGMSHIFGRAGIQAPSGGYGNPYMGRMSQQQRGGGGQPQQQQQQFPPELIEWIRTQMQERTRNMPTTPSGGAP